MISQRFKAIIDVIKQRKIVFITMTVLMIIIIVILSLSLNSQNSPAGIQPTKLPESINNSAIPVTTYVTSGSVNSNLPKWNTYEGRSFSLQFAPDWQLHNGDIASGGEFIIIKPLSLSEGAIYPNLILQTQPLKPGIVEQKIEIMKALGLKQTKINILGQTAHKLNGTIRLKNDNNTNSSVPLQETSLLLTENDVFYLIKYAYEGEQANNDLETYFGDVIKGIKLK